jgi:hypothetical protein
MDESEIELLMMSMGYARNMYSGLQEIIKYCTKYHLGTLKKKKNKPTCTISSSAISDLYKFPTNNDKKYSNEIILAMDFGEPNYCIRSSVSAFQTKLYF